MNTVLNLLIRFNIVENIGELTVGYKTLNKEGHLFIVSAPSGAGKTSVLRSVIESTKGVEVSVSHTTRQIREGEIDGVHYHFVARAGFQAIIDQNGFLEYAQVFDNFYGTSQQAVLDQLSTGKDVVLEIDWQGARQVRERIKDTVSVFILPPSRTALEQRLRSRGQDSEAVIARRMSDAESEMSHYCEFDYVLVNDDFDAAVAELCDIMTAVREGRSITRTVSGELLKDLLPEQPR